MTGQKGADILLKVGDAGSPENFTTVGGLRNTEFRFSSRPIDISTRESNHWRMILDDAGIRSVSISGNGLFTDSVSEHLVRSLAFGNTIRNYQIELPNGDVLSGAFKVTSFSRFGPHDEEEEYSMTLESDGQVIYDPAA